MTTCCGIFANYGVADIISSDEGPQFKGEIFELLLKKHDVEHRKSSVDYLQSNEHAGAAVKTAPRLVLKDALPGLPIHYKMHKFCLEQDLVRLKMR